MCVTEHRVILTASKIGVSGRSFQRQVVCKKTKTSVTVYPAFEMEDRSLIRSTS